MLGRALRRRCLRCGAGPIFRRYFDIVERCRGCGYPFLREDGYWVGAMIMNIGAAQLLFFAWFLGGLWLGWPDPPWTLLLVGGVTLMIAFPVLFYPWSKTLWLWFDLLLHPLPDGAAHSEER
jgi:uncharacterized protein (DUF983 family)